MSELPEWHRTRKDVRRVGNRVAEVGLEYFCLDYVSINGVSVTEHNNLFKLDPKYQDKGNRSEFLLGNEQTLKVKADGTHDYGLYNALQVPMSLYFSILASFTGCGGAAATTALIACAGFTHLCNIYKLSQDYEWPAVLSYHMEFHWHRQCEMTNGDYSQWGHTDPEL